MKRFVKIFALIAGIAALASCNKVATYSTAPFASVDFRTAEIEESADGTDFYLPVHIYNNSGDCTVTYKVEGITAENGVEFTPLNTSGVLNFPAGTDSLSIGVKVKGQPGTYTGNKTFKISLASATNDVQIGALNACTVTVKDLDHPLSAMFGTYTMSGISVNSSGNLAYPSWGFTMGPVDGDPTKIAIDNITPFAAAYGSYLDGSLAVIGTVSADGKTITIKTPQEVESTAGSWGSSEKFVFYKHEGYNGVYLTKDDVVTFTLAEDGSWSSDDSFGYSIPSDLAEYPDMFYYYCVVWTNFRPASYPTVFKKN